MMTFEQYFTTATGGNQPYDYQRRLAEDSACESRLIEIPTGLGKTAAVVLAWMWNRVHLQQHGWPHRLDLPRVELAPQTETGRAAYFAALEAADRRDFQPLVDLWRDRLAHAETPDA